MSFIVIVQPTPAIVSLSTTQILHVIHPKKFFTRLVCLNRKVHKPWKLELNGDDGPSNAKKTYLPTLIRQSNKLGCGNVIKKTSRQIFLPWSFRRTEVPTPPSSYQNILWQRSMAAAACRWRFWNPFVHCWSHCNRRVGRVEGNFL
jgi:hypothetical protein